jgi:hypothetical protein
VTGEALIIEAKGTSAGKVLNASKGRSKSWLGATIGEVDTYYLTKDWIIRNAEKRYMNKLQDVSPEAYELMEGIIEREEKYIASIVYGGSHNSQLTFGRGLDKFTDELKNSVNGIEFVKVNYQI